MFRHRRQRSAAATGAKHLWISNFSNRILILNMIFIELATKLASLIRRLKVVIKKYDGFMFMSCIRIRLRLNVTRFAYGLYDRPGGAI